MEYKEITIEQIEKALVDFYKEGRPTGFTLPQGRIGNTGAYRISDNCITGKGGWELYQKILQEKMLGHKKAP